MPEGVLQANHSRHETPGIFFRPRQLHLFGGEPEPIPVEPFPPWEEGREKWIDEGISMVRNEEGSQVILSGFGLFLGKKSERLVVRKGKEAIYQFPLFRLSEVIVSSRGVSVSSDLIEELCERGIRLTFLASSGRPYAMLTSPLLTATVITRREQILAFSDQRGARFCRAVVEGKIKNQARILKYFGKYLKQTEPETFVRLNRMAKELDHLSREARKAEGEGADAVRSSLMGLEGASGRIYWDGVKLIVGERVRFMGREHRGAADVLNSMLNYGYGILYGLVWGAILNAGLEPFAGFLHVDRPGKPSLVLDLVEEFRQPVVDRPILAHINLGEKIEIADGQLDAETRRAIGYKVLARLESQESFRGKRYQVKSIIQMQARSLASFLRGGKEYRPFAFKW